MTIVEAFKSFQGLRITYGREKWAVWTGSQWEVYNKPMYKKKVRILASTTDESEMMKVLTAE